jgi:hypothetical protein
VKVISEGETVMSSRTIAMKALLRGGMSALGTAALLLPLGTPTDARPGFNPVVVRGTSTAPASEPRLAYEASFPNGSLDPAVDKLNAGPMVPGDPLIPESNPTVSAAPGEVVVSIHRPVGLSPDLIPSESIWATPVNFGPGSVVRLRATFRAPVGPIPGGGFAFGLNARTGARDDLATETRIATTINVRPGFVVRFNVPFGAVETTNMTLPQGVKDAIFSTTDPQPFTMELTIDRELGKGTAKLTVADQVFSLKFTLSDFLADGGPVITAVGPGIAVNSNGPGQTASVHVRDFRIYANIGG